MLKEMVQAQTEGLVKINNQDLLIKEFNGKRIITFKDIDVVHERVEGTAGRNFRENLKHFIKNVDYFLVNGSELWDLKQTTNFVGSNAKEIILITESGYLMLVKSLQDNLAWKVQRELVNKYFRVKEEKPTCIEDLIIMQAQSMKDLKQQINQANNHALEAKVTATKTDSRVDHLEDTMVVDYSEQEFLNKHARARVLMAVGGKESTAYKKLSKVIFKELWGDYKTYFQINSYKNTPKAKYLEAIEYIANWEPSNNNKLEILHINSL